MNLAWIGFLLIIVLMYVLISEKISPPTAFVLLPILAALLAGFGLTEISEFIATGLGSMLNTAVLFMFSISYFTLMSEQGLFDPLVQWIMTKVGKNVTMILIAVVFVVVVSHLDGSGATTYLITVPAFMPLVKRYNIRPQALLGTMAGTMALMNTVPWGGPTIRASSVAEVEVGALYSFIMPAVAWMAVLALGIAVFTAWREKRRMEDSSEEILAVEIEDVELKKTSRGLFIFNLVLTVAMLALLFIDNPLPLHFIFMLFFAIALPVNYPSAKEQTKKIKEFGSNAMVMAMTLFSVGIFMGVLKDSGMVDAMAGAIISALPQSIAPHMHWFMALFAVPMMMVLGTDAYYYAMLPVIISVVEPFGISPETVAATFLITGTYGTFIGPTVAANYVGLGLADVTIGEHIKFSLPVMWAASILALIGATLLGVVQF